MPVPARTGEELNFMSRFVTSSWSIPTGLLVFALASTAGQIPAAAQDPALQPPAAASQGPGRTGGRGLGAGRGAGPTLKPSALRAIPAETLAAKVKDPNWKAPRTAWGHPDLEGTWTSDDMRGVPTSRPAAQADRESLTPEEFARRASGDESSRDRAVNQETILRNEFGVRTFGYTSFVVDPPNGQMPALTQDALARRKAIANQGTFGGGPWDDFDDFTLYDRCITRGVPGSVMPVLYGNGLLIAQSPNEVVISYEMVHDTRVIPLDGRPRLGANIKQYIGDSRGHWEGDTLVVETTNFTNKTAVGGAPHTDKMKLTEWFTRIDPQMIEYRFRVEDPGTFVAPFTMRMAITQQPGYQLFEYSCHEGNGAVGFALSGERAYEKLVAEAKAKGLPIPPRTTGMEVYSGAPVEGLQPVREFGSKK
jgi:hypothetical protein